MVAVRKTVFRLRVTLFLLSELFLSAVPKRYVVSVDGSDPFIRCQMERGLDWTISSVAGESYSVDVRRTLYFFYCSLIPVLTQGTQIFFFLLLLLPTAD